MADLEPIRRPYQVHPGARRRVRGDRSTADTTAARGVRGDDATAGMRRLLVAIGSLYDRAVDQVLAAPHDVRTAYDALTLLDERHRDSKAMTEQIGRVAVLAVPVIRRLQTAGRVARLPGVRRLPLLASATTVASTVSALTRGVRDVQVIGSFAATRLAEANGGVDVEPDLVKRVTVQLYLAPGSPVRLDRRIGTARLLRRWLTRGLLGRDAKRVAERAVSAVSRMDAGAVVAQWRALNGTDGGGLRAR